MNISQPGPQVVVTVEQGYELTAAHCRVEVMGRRKSISYLVPGYIARFSKTTTVKTKPNQDQDAHSNLNIR